MYREYLYSETELYSLLDLEQLYRGELLPVLARSVELCTAHVERYRTVPTCTARGGRNGALEHEAELLSLTAQSQIFRHVTQNYEGKQFRGTHFGNFVPTILWNSGKSHLHAKCEISRSLEILSSNFVYFVFHETQYLYLHGHLKPGLL